MSTSSSTTCWQNFYPFSCVVCLSNISWLCCMGLFLGSLFCSIDLFFYYFASITLSQLLWLYSNFWSWMMLVLQLCFSSLLYLLFCVLFCFLINWFILFLFLAALGLCCCTRTFSSCGERGLLFVAVHGLLIAVASLVAEHGL